MLNSKKINILFVHGSLNIGGAEELRRIFLKHIDRGRYNVTVCSLTRKGPIGESIEDMGFRVICFDNSEKLYDLRNFFSVFKLLLKNKFDIVQPSMFIAATFSILPARLIGVPVIIPEEHCREVWKKGYHKLIDRLNFCLADKIIAVSDDVKKFTSKNEGVSENKFTVLSNTADTDKFKNWDGIEDLKNELNLDKNLFILGSIGRLHAQKDYSCLFDALIILNKKNCRTKLLIVGVGPLENKLKALAKELELENDILFLGTQKDIGRFFKTIDLFVLSSIYEGQPISILEAMAIGLPIAATNVGGLSELIIDKESGMLVPSREPVKLADAIICLLRDRELALRMGEAAKIRFLKYFNPAGYSLRMQSLHESLLLSKG